MYYKGLTLILLNLEITTKVIQKNVNKTLKGLHASQPRNILIADVCFKGGYIDSWGRGMLKIYNAC
ncbi:hypothetical protein [Sphingobacterium bovisgrunnientis]|uniref:hypothetical protein n=1 Tax=Sphingobacterium bovisgrunnientis TaxID=1874697 RepID=UPI0018657F24|nr:hypothetical protein [Sphingobacterium bovisgrunnientis]